MTGDYDHSRTKPSDVSFSKQPPGNPDDIKVTSHAIDIIAEDADLKPAEREIVAKWLPVILLDYFLPEHAAKSVPAEKKLEGILKKLERHLSEASAILAREEWIKTALIGRKRRRAVEGLASQFPEQYETYIERSTEAAREAAKEFEAQIDTLNRLRDSVSRLPFDPVLKAASGQRTRTANASKPELRYLGGHIHNVWTRQLGHPPEIGLQSRYVRFAQAIYGLVWHDTISFETLKSRLREAASWVDSLSR